MWMNIRNAIDLRQQNQIAKMRFYGKTYTDELFIADKCNQFSEESILKLINDNDINNYVTYPYLDEGEQTQEFLIMEIHREDIVKAIMNLNKKRSTDIVSDVVLSLAGIFFWKRFKKLVICSVRPKVRFRPVSAEKSIFGLSFGFGQKMAETFGRAKTRVFVNYRAS